MLGVLGGGLEVVQGRATGGVTSVSAHKIACTLRVDPKCRDPRRLQAGKCLVLMLSHCTQSNKAF